MALRSVTGKVTLQLQATLVNTLNNTGKTATSQVGNASFVGDTYRVSGVSSGEMNRAWEDTEIAISSGADLELNLATLIGEDIGAGFGKDAVGQTIDLEEVVMIVIKNTTTANAGALGGPFLEIQPAMASGWTAIGEHTVANSGAIPPGGVLLKYAPGEAGFDVQPGTAERIKLTASGGDITASILIFGRNDDDESSSSSSASSLSSSVSSVSTSSISSSLSSSVSSSSTS